VTTVVELKNPAQIASLREAGRVVAHALIAVKDAAVIGVSLEELDEVAAMVIKDAGAKPAFLNYHPSWAPTPFPGVICASVNDEVVHGIPDRTRLVDGDLLSIDCGAFVDGWCGDAAITFTIGAPDTVDLALIDATAAALQRGIGAAISGARMGDVAFAIGIPAREAGYGLLAGHGGHGVGRAMHEEPFVPNEGRPGHGFRLRPGLVFAIEPMLILGGGDDYVTDADGWTLRSASGSKAAHVEHTIAVTEDGPIVLTAP
jgi:methionyl aminopeptidase